MEIIEWRGWKVSVSPLTEILLWLEDRMEEATPTFVQMVGKRELWKHLKSKDAEFHEGLVVFTSAFEASLASFLKPSCMTSVSPEIFTRLLIEMAQDNGHNILFLDGYDGSERSFVRDLALQSGRLRSLSEILHSQNDLEKVVIETRAEVIVSEWSREKALASYQHLTERHGQRHVWIQLPTINRRSEGKKGLGQWQEILLRVHLLRLALTRNPISSGSK